MVFRQHFYVKNTDDKNIVLALPIINDMADISVIKIRSLCFPVDKLAGTF